MTEKTQLLSESLTNYGELTRDARNKLIAHADQNIILKDLTLGTHPKAEQMMFFDNLQTYCDEVGNSIGYGPLVFRTQACNGDVQDLLKMLQKTMHKI